MTAHVAPHARVKEFMPTKLIISKPATHIRGVQHELTQTRQTALLVPYNRLVWSLICSMQYPAFCCMHAKVCMSGCWKLTSGLSFEPFRGQWYWKKQTRTCWVHLCVRRGGHTWVTRGVRGLSSHRPPKPSHPGPILDAITGNWIVSYLLWEQPGWDPPSLLQP